MVRPMPSFFTRISNWWSPPTGPSLEQRAADIIDRVIQENKALLDKGLLLESERAVLKSDVRRLGLVIHDLQAKLSAKNRKLMELETREVARRSPVVGTLTKAAVDFLRREQGSRDEIPEAWTKVLAEAEGMTPEREWANLTTKERSSVMAYLADDAEEYAEHRQTNLVVLSLLLLLENRRLKESRR